MTRSLFAATLALAACASTPIDTAGFERLTATPAPEGDPVAGFDHIATGDHNACGIPMSIYESTGGLFPEGLMPEPQPLPGREGPLAELPYYLSRGVSARGVEVVNTNCLLCHAGTVNGDLVPGLGNAHMPSAPLNALAVRSAELARPDEAEQIELDVTLRVAEVVDRFILETVGANHGDAALLGFALHRDPETLAWLDAPLAAPEDLSPLPMDVPAWWHLRKKAAMFANTAVRGDYTAFVMNGALACTETTEQAAAVVDAAADVRAWLDTLEPPPWPFAPPDEGLVARGERVFERSCAACHGTYGERETYPNLVVPVSVVGTDPASAGLQELWELGWELSFQHTPYGQGVEWSPQAGYMAPPLDGIWATAPYLHNGSVPTLAQLLDSATRAEAWARTEREGTRYDRDEIGLDHVVIGRDVDRDEVDPDLVYDTLDARWGFSNQGHTFGDDLSEGEREALLEYLKTL